MMKTQNPFFLSIVILVASITLVYARSVTSQSDLSHLKASNPINENQLTARNWDALVTEVENLKFSQNECTTQNKQIVRYNTSVQRIEYCNGKVWTIIPESSDVFTSEL